jgi:hypothetical protein
MNFNNYFENDDSFDKMFEKVYKLGQFDFSKIFDCVKKSDENLYNKFIFYFYQIYVNHHMNLKPIENLFFFVE